MQQGKADKNACLFMTGIISYFGTVGKGDQPTVVLRLTGRQKSSRILSPIAGYLALLSEKETLFLVNTTDK